MARGVNKVILVGRLGQDPETRYLPSGGAVTNVTLATSEQWKDKHSGDPQERTEWHRLVFFNRLAEIAGEYLQKGAQIYAEGSLRTRKWQDQSGHDRYTTEIVVGEMQMLDSRADAGGRAARPQPSASGDDGHRPATPSPTPGQGYDPNLRGQPQHSAPATSTGAAGGFDNFDDDIPFNKLGPEASF